MTEFELMQTIQSDPAFRHQGAVQQRGRRHRLRWRERRPDGSIRHRSIAIQDPETAAAVRQELERLQRPLRMAQMKRKRRREERHRVFSLKRWVLARTSGSRYTQRTARAFNMADRLGRLDVFLALRPWELLPRPPGRPPRERPRNFLNEARPAGTPSASGTGLGRS